MIIKFDGYSTSPIHQMPPHNHKCTSDARINDEEKTAVRSIQSLVLPEVIDRFIFLKLQNAPRIFTGTLPHGYP